MHTVAFGAYDITVSKESAVPIFVSKNSIDPVLEKQPQFVKSETCPTSFMLETLFSSMLKTRGTIVEIDKVDMFNTVLPIIEHDYEPLWEKLKFFELPEGKFKIRSLETEDLINELKNKEKDFLLA